MMRMPFGKFRGTAIANLPDWYLHWLGDLPDLREPLLSAVQVEIERRDAEEAEPAARASDVCPNPQLAHDLVGAGLKVLARRFHPDLPGRSTDRMREANLVAAWLRAKLRELCA